MQKIRTGAVLIIIMSIESDFYIFNKFVKYIEVEQSLETSFYKKINQMVRFLNFKQIVSKFNSIRNYVYFIE
jgi:hypothetical protein